ncbi:MAG: C39 family peptidase [Marmoricola sp.]
MRSRLVSVSLGLVIALPVGAALTEQPAPAPTVATVRLAAATSVSTSYGQNTYTSRSGSGLTQGTNEGTKVSSGKLVMAGSFETRHVAGRSWQTARWTSHWITPRHVFTELIPSWQATTPANSWVQIGVRAKTTRGTTTSYDQIGKWTTRDSDFQRTSAGSQTDDLAHVNTDTFVADPGTQLTSWQVRVTLQRAPGAGSPSLTKIGGVASLLPGSVPGTSKRLYGARTLAVPTYSQMTHRGQYPQYGGGGEAWCSPTSTTMIMGYYGRLPARSSYAWVRSSYSDPFVDHVARMTYDYGYRGTGNWAFNTAFANQYVDDAFVTRLRDLREAERFIHAGIPLAASISFDRGGLSGAPISSTAGHLVVIVGFTSAGNVVVNDPAASSDRYVRRTYDRAQFERAWLRKSGGTVYVIHDAKHPLPVRGANTNW